MSNFASSYVKTVTAAVTRNADVLTYPSAGNVSGTVGWCYAEATTAYAPSFAAAGRILASYPAADFIFGDNAGKLAIYDGTAWRGGGNDLMSAATPTKSAGSWGGTSTQTSQSGTVNAAAGFDGNVGVGAVFAVGCQSDGTSQIFGTIRNVRIGQRQLSASEMQAITAA